MQFSVLIELHEKFNISIFFYSFFGQPGRSLHEFDRNLPDLSKTLQGLHRTLHDDGKILAILKHWVFIRVDKKLPICNFKLGYNCLSYFHTIS